MRRARLHVACLLMISLLVFNTRGILGQSVQHQQRIDSLELALLEAVEDSVRLELLVDLTDALTAHDATLAINYADRAIQLGREMNDNYYLAYLLHLEAISNADLGNYAAAIDNLERAIEATYHDMQIYEEEWIPELACELTSYYNNLGYVYFEQGNYLPAVEYFLKSLDIGGQYACAELSLPYGSIAEVFFALGDNNRARDYLSKAQEVLRDSTLYLYDISILGNILLSENKPDSAMQFYQQMLSQGLPGNEKYNRIVAWTGIANTFLVLGVTDSAAIYAQRAFESASSINTKVLEAEAALTWGQALIRLGQVDEGQRKISTSIEVASDIHSLGQLLKSVEICAEYYSTQGDFAEAFGYQRQAIQLRDSLLGFDRTRLLVQSTLSRELEIKESEALALEQRLKEDQALIRRSKSFGIAMLLFGLGVAFIVYLTMRLRQGKMDRPRNDFYHHRTDNPAKFFYRIVLGTMLMLVPILIHSIVWNNTRLTWAIVAVLVFNAIVLSFTTYKRLKWLIWLAMPVAYLFIAVTPLYVGPMQIIVIAIPAVFLVLAYTIEDFRAQIANGILATAAFTAHQLLLPHSVPMIQGNPPGLEFMVGLMSLGIIFTAMYYYHGQIRDYRASIESTNNFLSQISNANPHFIYAKDRQRRFTFANRALVETYDEDSASIIGKRDEDILAFFKTDTHFRDDDEAVLNNGETRRIEEERILLNGGEERWLETIKQPIFDENGNITGLLGVSMDITEKRRTQQELGESVSLLKATFESTDDGLLVVNMNNEIVQFNEKFLDIWNIAPEVLVRSEAEALQIAAGQLVEPGQFRSRVEEIYNDPATVTFDTLLFRNGRICERYSQPQKIANRIVGRVWSFRDVTERHNATSNLRASEERYRLLFETTFDGFVILRNGEIVDANHSAVDLLGYPDIDTLRHKTLVAMFPALAQKPQYAMILSGEVENTSPLQLQGRNFFGDELAVEISMCEMTIDSTRHVACAIRNIAEKVILEKKEKEIENQRTEMEALNREIASYALLSSQKHRLLSEIKDEISEAGKLNGDLLNKAIARVNRKIDSNINESEDMVAFKIQFEKVHPNFFNRLMRINPKLTNNDLKYCAYIRLNMSTQDICDLLYVERKTVEMTKYRIKKKLGLKKEERLSEFIYAI